MNYIDFFDGLTGNAIREKGSDGFSHLELDDSFLNFG